MNKKALIAMSGGVDSAVAAYLMSDKDFECFGVTMSLGSDKLCHKQSCLTQKDIEDAKNVSQKLGIPFMVVDFSDRFEEKVVKNFVDTYLDAGTPNPCVECNRYLKFEKLMEKMNELECDYVVTGHYARVEWNEQTKRFVLKKGKDETKDQSYVLYSLTQEQLSHTLFPLGEYSKDEIRKIAKENGFVNADKKESQDICFVPDGDYAAFIERYTGKKAKQGKFLLNDGTVLGNHKGIIRYTIGQRKGLGISYSKPLFVLNKSAVDNTVTLGDEKDLFKTELYAEKVNLISVESITEPIRCKAKVRYRQKEEWATAVQEGDKLKIVFDTPQRAFAKGQAVVLYDGDIVIGGGTIL